MPFLFFLLTLVTVPVIHAQSALAPDQPGCTDSKVLPRFVGCRIDNCEKKDGDRRDVPIREYKGDAVTAVVEGDSRSVMYECHEGTTPASIVEQAATALTTAKFDIPYRFAEAEGFVTARKEELWVLVDSAGRFFTLTEIRSIPPDFDSISDAESMAEMIERYGYIPLYGVHFIPGRADMSPESTIVLEEVYTVLADHPDWALRVEGHTDNTGTKLVNQTLSQKRAATVVAWLALRGIKRFRLDAQGIGDAHPVADNGTEAGRSKNRRIVLVKVVAPVAP